MGIVVYSGVAVFFVSILWLIWGASGYTRASLSDLSVFSHMDFAWGRIVWPSIGCGVSAATFLTLVLVNSPAGTVRVNPLVAWVVVACVFTVGFLCSGVLMQGIFVSLYRSWLARQNGGSASGE